MKRFDAMGSAILSLAVYKIACLLVGALCIVLGYHLLVRGIVSNPGEFEVALGKDLKLILKRATPGTLFALFGAGIVVYTISIGFEIVHSGGGDSISRQEKPPLTGKPTE